MKLSRNDACWCGSQRKYKSCHLQFDQKLEVYASKGVEVPPHNIIKTPEQIEGIRTAGKLNTEILDMVSEKVQEGISTEELNTIVHDYTIKHGAIPAPLGYNGFPKSICTSINSEVCHGIPDKNTILQDGDIVNIDITTILNGYYADASRMFMIGNVSSERKHLVKTAKECLDIGILAAKPYGFLGDIGEAINDHATLNGYTIVLEVGGHGVGLDFHEDPYVCHVGRKGTDMLLVPGMVFTVEPMVNMGKRHVYEDKDNGWTIRTEDGEPSAQWEHTIAITDTGVEILTY